MIGSNKYIKIYLQSNNKSNESSISVSIDICKSCKKDLQILCDMECLKCKLNKIAEIKYEKCRTCDNCPIILEYGQCFDCRSRLDECMEC